MTPFIFYNAPNLLPNLIGLYDNTLYLKSLPQL